jgi:hypothetical protein
LTILLGISEHDGETIGFPGIEDSLACLKKTTPSGDFESGCDRMPIAATPESRFRRTAASKIECGGGEDHAAHRVLENVA